MDGDRQCGDAVRMPAKRKASTMADTSADTSLHVEELALSQEWDKTFAQSDLVDHTKVSFPNRFGITLAADIYIPKTAAPKGGYDALAVCGPFGAVKEQASGLYAQTMAERGFLTLAFDPSFTGESAGQPRYMNSPDISTEDFEAAVDYLSCRDDVNPSRIGIIGICGWGGISLNATAADTRIRACAAITMYDMCRVTANGYFDADDNAEARTKLRHALSEQRTEDFRSGSYALAGGVVDPLPADAPQFVQDYYAYYKQPRGYHPRSLNSNGGWAITSSISWANARFMHYIGEIASPVMVMHGEKAHSLYMGKSAYEALAAGTHPENKKLVVVPGAVHCDLYDGGPEATNGKGGFIPWDTLVDFFQKGLA